MASKKYQIPVLNPKAANKMLELNPKLFGSLLKPVSLAQVLRVYISNSHQQTKKTKTRGEVAASTRKIWKQKGTGNARHGALSAPIFVGGGVAHGPKGNKGSLRVNRKLSSKALASLLFDKFEKDSLFALNPTKADKPSTKSVNQLFKAQKIDSQRTVLIYAADDPQSLIYSTRNMSHLSLVSAALLNPLHLSQARAAIITPSAVKQIETRLLPDTTVKADKTKTSNKLAKE